MVYLHWCFDVVHRNYKIYMAIWHDNGRKKWDFEDWNWRQKKQWNQCSRCTIAIQGEATVWGEKSLTAWRESYITWRLHMSLRLRVSRECGRKVPFCNSPRYCVQQYVNIRLRFNPAYLLPMSHGDELLVKTPDLWQVTDEHPDVWC